MGQYNHDRELVSGSAKDENDAQLIDGELPAEHQQQCHANIMYAAQDP